MSAPCLDCGGSVGIPNGRRPPQRCPTCRLARKRLMDASNMRRYRAEGKHPARRPRDWNEAQLAIFWAKVKKGSACWEWTAGRMTSGYGLVQTTAGRLGAHRASWEIHRGPIPDGLMVLHSCDNKLCVNPAHLSLGTHRQNTIEAMERRRYQYGDDHWRRRYGQEADEARKRSATAMDAALRKKEETA